jgi:hypothetical protein
LKILRNRLECASVFGHFADRLAAYIGLDHLQIIHDHQIHLAASLLQLAQLGAHHRRRCFRPVVNLNRHCIQLVSGIVQSAKVSLVDHAGTGAHHIHLRQAAQHSLGDCLAAHFQRKEGNDGLFSGRA